jgi:hypothetical protein
MYSSFLRISSAERINQSDPISNFNVSIGNDANLQKITMIAVKEVTIPNSQYNIRGNYNNILYIDNLGTVYQYAIIPGQYNVSNLINALNISQSYVEFGTNPISNIIEVKTNSFPGCMLVNGAYSIIKQLGGENLYNVPLSVIKSAFSKLPDLAGARNYYVSSLTLSDGNSMISPTLPKMGIIAVVPNTANFGNITYYNSNEQKLDEIYYPSQIHGKNLTSIDLQLRNLDGSFVDLNGLDWSILIKVHYN